VTAPELPHRYDVEVVALVAGAAHRMDGRPTAPAPDPAADARDVVAVRAGHGVVGDRYAGRPAHRDASVTVLAVEALEAVATAVGAAPFDPHAPRRTVVLRGAEVEALRGVRFALDCGDGEVVLQGGRPAHPCAWMDLALAAGAHRALRGRGGVRCAPLTDGRLRLGPAVLRSAVPLDPHRAGDPVRTLRPRGTHDTPPSGESPAP
jgi:MOSC domain-containing protein YiiM